MAVLAFAVICAAAPAGAAPSGSQAQDDCVDPCADLAVSMEATNEVVGAGERFSYSLTVENDGPTNADAVTLTQTLPPSVTFLSAVSESLQCTEGEAVVSCTAPVLELDGAAEVEVAVQAPEAIGTIVTAANLSSTTPEFDAENNTSVLATEVATGADLLLYTYAEAATTGEPVHFHVAVLNDGPQAAHGVAVADTLPAGVDLISVTPSAGTCASSGRDLNCWLDTVPAFELVEVEIVVTGVSDAALTNLASVTSTGPSDPDSANNDDRATALIGHPAVVDLTISNDASTEVIGPGERFRYYLSVANDGPAGAAAVTLTDELPAGVHYVSASGLPCTAAGQVVTCTAGDLEADGIVDVELVVEAPAAVQTLVSEARVTAATPDLDPSYDDDSVAVRMGTGSDLGVDVYAEPAQPTQPVHFVVSAWNDGPQSAHDVLVEDLLPEGVDLISATPTAGSCSAATGRRLTCALGTLEPFSEVAIDLVVSGVTEGVLANVASATATEPADADPGNNRAIDAVVVGAPPVADVIAFTEAPETAALDSEVVYTLSVENAGPELARGVRLTDQLGAGSTFVSVTTDRGACSHADRTVACELGDLAVDEAITVEVKVLAVEDGRLRNVAELVATGGPADPVPNSNTSIVTTVVGKVPAADDRFAVKEDSILAVAAPGVLGNDRSVDGSSLEAVLADNADHGRLTLKADGAFAYKPTSNFSGTDSFVYRASDGEFESNPATVTITVKAVNDAPRASADRYGARQDTTLIVDRPGVLANDSDVDSSSLTAALVAGADHGSVTLAPDGSFSFAPYPGFHGVDSFTYRANDGSLDSGDAVVTIDVAAAPAPPPAPPAPAPAELRRLTVIKRGTGTGTVTSTGIDCGTDCIEDYALGASVAFRAAPAPGSRFVSWAGACGVAATTCTVTMDIAKSLTANFAKVQKRPTVVKRTMCFRKRTIKVPKSKVARYKKRGAKLGACKKARKRR